MNMNTKNTVNTILYSLLMMLLISSCSSNFLSGRKFNLDLVKVEKKQIEKASPKVALQIPGKSTEVISASSENQILLSSFERQILNDDLDLNLQQDSIVLSKINTSTKHLSVVLDSINVKKATAEPKAPAPNVHWDWVSILSIVAGLISAILLGFFLSELILLWLFLSLLSLVLGAIGLSRTEYGKLKGRGFAIAGFILGLAQLIFLIILIVFFFLYFFSY